MPHAALWVVQPVAEAFLIAAENCFNAARGFVGGATVSRLVASAAPWRFNAARGFVGGATILMDIFAGGTGSFNAARGFVGGAA